MIVKIACHTIETPKNIRKKYIDKATVADLFKTYFQINGNRYKCRPDSPDSIFD